MNMTDIKIKFVEDKLDKYIDIVDHPLEPYTHYIYRTEINDIYHLYITLDDMRMSREYIQDKIDLVCSLQPSDYKEFRLLLGDFDLYHCNYYEKMLRLDKSNKEYQIDHYIDEVWKDIGAYYYDYDRGRFMRQYEYNTFGNPRDKSIRHSKTYHGTFFPFYKENELEERNFKYYRSDDKSVHIVFFDFDKDEEQENSTLGFIFFTDMTNRARVLPKAVLRDYSDFSIDGKEAKDYEFGSIVPIGNNIYIVDKTNSREHYFAIYGRNSKQHIKFKEFSSYKNVQDAVARGEVNRGDYIRILSRYGIANCICAKKFDNIGILSGITEDDDFLLMYIIAMENFNDIKIKKEKGEIIYVI